MAKTRYKEDERPVRGPEPVARDGAYVTMLVITLVAILAGCVMLYLDHKDYGGKQPTKEAAPVIPKLGEGTKTDTTPKGDGTMP